ncbi:hypothetical protein BN1723_020372, partial [Verticillium longisporum]
GRDQRRQRHGRGQGQAVVRGERRRDPRRPLLATSARRSHPQPLVCASDLQVQAARESRQDARRVLPAQLQHVAPRRMPQ